MRFVVIGASGFVGRNILAYLRGLGLEALGTQANSREEGLITFDIRHDRLVERLGRSFFERDGQVCLILAAVISNMDLCFQQKEMSRAVNVEGTIRLIEEGRSLGVKPLFLSTCFVFDGAIGYYREDHPLTPINEYSRQKAEVEAYLEKNVSNAFVARLDKIVGDNPDERQLLATWYRDIVEGRPIVCISGSVLSPTYVGDVARSLLLACQNNMRGVFHVSNSEFFHRDELARQFCYALSRTPNVISKPVETFNFVDKRALKSYLDGSRFAKATGVRFTSMREVFEAFHRRAAGAVVRE